MLPRQLRVRKDQIPEIMRFGKSFLSQTSTLKIIHSPNTPQESLFTVVVGAKIAPLAVDRNKIKRQFRHIISKHKSNIKPGFMMVFLASKMAPKSLFIDIERDILYLLSQAGLIKNNK
ncbi:MAG: Ribonuclease protein component [Patescibacteria group bacterium]|nr:Ribonuclease protein component [Patescibacteria group bacterium]